MISTNSKFPTRSQFLAFRSTSSQFTTPHLRVMLAPHSPSRLSVIIPVKVNKRAVVRNAFKRLVYDAVWKIISTKNHDCIVLFKPIVLLKGQSSLELIKSEIAGLKCF